MQLNNIRQPPLAVTAEEYQVGKQWIIDLHTMYERNELHRLNEFAEDTATFRLCDLPVASGLSEKKRLLQWQIDSTSRLEHIVHSISVFPTQIIMDFDVVYHFQSGETETIPFITTVDKSTQSTKSTGFVVSGDLSKLLARVAAAK